MNFDLPDPSPSEVLWDMGLPTSIAPDDILSPDWDSAGWESMVPENIKEFYPTYNVWQKCAVAIFAEQLLNKNI